LYLNKSGGVASLSLLTESTLHSIMLYYATIFFFILFSSDFSPEQLKTQLCSMEQSYPDRNPTVKVITICFF